MNLQKYTAFVKAVEFGSFTKAAEHLNYSQSGISRMIADLEKDFGISLLERGKSGVRLTSDGMKLLPHIKTVVDDYEKMKMQVDELQGLHTGFIRIGAFSSVATHWLPHIIKKFQSDYPNIDYEILLGDYKEIEQWIEEGRVDCGFLKLPIRSELDAQLLQRDRLLAVIPQNHRLADCEQFPIEAFCDDPFILLEKGENAGISEIFKRCGLKPQVHVTTWDDYAVMSMVENGLGLSILPELILKRAPYRILKKPLNVPAYRDIGFVLKDRNSASVATKKFMEYLKYRK